MSEASVFLIARILGISSSAFLSGFAFSASYLGIPSLAPAPIPLRLQQWQVIYDLGKLVSPTVTAASTLLWGFTAWSARGSEVWKFYAVGGLATFAILPWTVAVMMPTNLDLMRRAKVAKEDAESLKFEKESEVMLAKWNIMNYVRAVLPMIGAWVGLYAALR
jgi:hypothetical protein